MNLVTQMCAVGTALVWMASDLGRFEARRVETVPASSNDRQQVIPGRTPLNRQWPPFLHLAPTQRGPSPGGPFIEACLQMDQWPEVLSRTTHFGNADWIFAEAREGHPADADLRACFARMRAHHLKLVIESPVIKPQCIGAECFVESKAIYDHLIALGASLDVVSMDSPFGDSKYTRPVDPQMALDETVKWIGLVRSTYPAAEIMDIEQLNGGLTESDLRSWMTALWSLCRRSGITPPDIFEIDHDWTSGGWSWTGIAQLQETANELGMNFGVIFWSANHGKAKSPTDQDWYDGLLDQGDLYLRNSERIPDMYSVNDWLSVPIRTLPEGTADYSYMRSVRDFITRYVYPFKNTPRP